jgi:hypothetical protein
LAVCEAFSDDIPSLSRAPRVQGLRGPRYGYVPYYFRACEALSLAELGGPLLKAWGATRRRGPTSCLELVIRGRQRRSGTIAIDGRCVNKEERKSGRASIISLASPLPGASSRLPLPGASDHPTRTRNLIVVRPPLDCGLVGCANPREALNQQGRYPELGVLKA